MSGQWHDALTLGAIMSQLSFLAIGGIAPVLPEMQRQVTDLHHWMTPREFAALFALAQAAPGPNMLVTTLVGWRVAGLAGAITATAGICGPPCILTYFTASLWQRFRNAPWRRLVQAGLTPVTCGMVMAAAVMIARASVHGLGTSLVVLISVVLLLTTRLHPLLLLAAAAAAGASGILG
jgi:chromate transporter